MRKREPQKIKLVFGLKTRLIVLAAIACFLVFKLQSYHSIRLSMDQVEMMPTIVPGQNVYLYSHSDKQNYLPGDIIYFKMKDENRFHFAKIGAKNEGSVEIKDKNLWIDGELYQGTKDKLPIFLQKKYQLKENEYFLVQNDPTVNWLDSISLGPIPMNKIEIKGKLFFFMKQDSEEQIINPISPTQNP